MSTRAVAACVACAALGCTLTYPLDDYFDERGIETIALVDDVQEIAVGRASLYASDGERLVRVPARGEVRDPVLIARTTREGIHGLVANGASLVAWCDGSDGGAWYTVDDGPAQRVPGSTTCAAMAVGPDVVIHLARSKDRATVRRFVVSKQAFDADLSLPRSADDPVLTTTSDGAAVLSSALGVVRQCSPGDDGCEDGLCRISSVSRPPEVRTFRVGAGGRPLLVTALQAILFAPTASCCRLDSEDCATDAVRSMRGVSTADAFDVLDGDIYALRQGHVLRVWSFVDPAKDEVVAPAPANASLLAVDHAQAYFVDGNKIERSPLRIP